jgi:hypothetical protein
MFSIILINFLKELHGSFENSTSKQEEKAIGERSRF